MFHRYKLLLGIAVLCVLPAPAQQGGTERVIGRISLVEARDAWFSGAVTIDKDAMAVSDGSVVTTSHRTTHVSLDRGGKVNVCAASSVQLTQSGDSVLLSLERGALETHYMMAKQGMSDVVQTPDLRILISAPGESDLRIRVSGHGDTCVENHGGDDAAYVSVIPQVGNGLFRVEAGQRVMFEHGNLRAVADVAPNPCGCPPAVTPRPEEPPMAIAAQTPMPVPAFPEKPIAAGGQVHAQVSASLEFDSKAPAAVEPGSSTEEKAESQPAVVQTAAVASPSPTPGVLTQRPVPVPPPLAVITAQPVAAEPPEPTEAVRIVPIPAMGSTGARPEKTNDLVHVIGRFFSRLFGRQRSITY